MYILTETAVTIGNKDDVSKTDDKIFVDSGVSANITLAGVNIDVSATNFACAFRIADNSTGEVTITLADGTINVLKSGYCCAGLQKNGTSGKLTINGTGTIEATGGKYGAGIGGSDGGTGSGITISGGTVTATGGSESAGIGGGYNGAGSDITISGGSVKAIAGSNANAIGGGENAAAVTPTNGSEDVYLIEIANEDGKDIVINGKNYPDAHGEEKKIYAYLPAKTAEEPNLVGFSGCRSQYYYTGEAWQQTGVKLHVDENGDEICDVCKEYVDGIGAKLIGYTLSLNGNIGVNFYMELSEDIANSNTAYMQFTLPNGDVTTVNVAGATTKAINTKTYYVFPCEVSSFEMTKPIKAQMFDGNGNSGTEYSYTVRDYGKYIIDHPTSYEEKDVAFAKALLNYGAYSQAYFKVAVDDLANTSLDEAEKNVTDVTAESLAGYKAVSVSNAFGTFAGYSLTLKSETTLKVYFEPAADVDVSSLTFTAAGQTVTPVISGQYYVLSVENIKAWNLDTPYDFSVSNGSETLNFSCSAMSYAYSVLLHSESYDSTLVKLISALRIYQQKAEVYGN